MNTTAPTRAPKTPLTLVVERIAFPAGVAVLMTDLQGRVRVLDFEDYEARMQRLLRLHYGEDGWTARETAEPTGPRMALEAYFAGDLAAIDQLATETAGTVFQRAVWKALREIPAGQTASYRQIAARVGRPAAVRATGAANGANPIGIIVPCHRVVGANGDLTGYGGGLPRKRWLLQHEGALKG